MVISVVPQEGAGHAVLSAYVEIVFDNADNRFPVSPHPLLPNSACCDFAARPRPSHL